jgi:chitinase
MISYNAIYPKIHDAAYTYRWDDSAKQPAVYNGAEWIGFEDEASIAAKALYADTYGLGGAIVWTVEEGAVPGQGNPLLSAMKRYFLKR